MPLPTGTPIRAEFVGGALTIQPMVLYGDGSVTPIVMGANDYLVFDLVTLMGSSSGSVQFIDDQNGDDLLSAGELIAAFSTTSAASPMMRQSYHMGTYGHQCKRGAVPKVKGPAGTIRAILRGVLVEG